jgi:PAS domain S-box-containing protein
MELLLAILSFITVSLLIIKAIAKKDYTILVSALSRLYLFFVMLYIVVTGVNFPDNDLMFISNLAICTVLLTDIGVNAYYLLTKTIREHSETLRLMSLLGKINNKFYTALESFPVGIYIIDKNGKFEYVNPKFCEISGYDKTELLTMTIFNLIKEKDVGFISKILKDKIEGVVPYSSYDLVGVSKSQKEVKVRITSFRSENGHPNIVGNITVCEE